MGHVNTGNRNGLTGFEADLIKKGMKPSQARIQLTKSNGYVAPGYALKTADINCSLCTAAGAYILWTGRFMSSGDVSAELGSPCEDKRLFADWFASQSFPKEFQQTMGPQEEGVYYYLKNKLRCQTDVYGHTLTMRPWSVVKEWMQKTHKPGTVYAVRYDCHWLNAHKDLEDQRLEFIDFQTDTQDPPGKPTVDDVPFIALSTPRKRATRDEGVLAIAFMP